MWVAQSLTVVLAKLDKTKNLVLKKLNWNAKVTNVLNINYFFTLTAKIDPWVLYVQHMVKFAARVNQQPQ